MATSNPTTPSVKQGYQAAIDTVEAGYRQHAAFMKKGLGFSSFVVMTYCWSRRHY